MNKKIILAIALTICLLLSALPIQVSAEQTTILEMILDMIFPQPSETEYIKILNPVSTPTLWGRWIVDFETRGQDDLEIEAYLGTFFEKDIEFLWLYCGDEIVEVEKYFSDKNETDFWFEGIDNGKVIARNWNCDNEKAKLALRILATGHHHLKFSFLGENAYAENFANCSGTDVSPCHCCDVNHSWVTVIAPGAGGESGPHVMTYQSSQGTCGSPLEVNETWTYDLGYTFCPTEGAYTANLTVNASGGDTPSVCNLYENETTDPPLSLYSVNWDTDENWCNCNMTATGCDGGSCWGSTRGFGFDTGTTSDCCGDDASEFYRYCNYSSPQTGFPDSGDCIASDDRCCNTTSDCVIIDGSSCIPTTNTNDADSDGDVDYCLNSKWYDCYNNNAHCSGSYTCQDYDCVDYVIDGGSETTCDATNKCLLIQNSTGSVKARFDQFGYVDVKGGYSYTQSSLSPPSGSFILNSTSDVVLYIDSNGNLNTTAKFTNQTSPSPSGNNDFIIKDSGGVVAGYIDGGTGNMYFKGVLHYNSDF